MEGYGNIEINCKQISCGNMDWIHPNTVQVVLEKKITCGERGESFSSGRHHHVKEILGHRGPVSHKRGRDMQGQGHRPWSFEENSVL